MSGENSVLPWLPTLAGLAVKSLLVFLIAGAALLALRRASASARHLVCLLTLAGLLALPLLSAALPGWRLVVLAGPTPALRATPPETGGGGVVAGGKVGVDKGGVGKAGAASGAPTPIASSSSRFGRTPVSGANKEVGSFLWLLPLWLAGALLSLLRPGFGLWGIGQLSRASEPVTDSPALTLAAECAAALGLARTPALRRAGAPVPMTWGWRRPVVLLPDGARDWTEGRLRAVLLHELAHVRRRDWLSHRMADAVCALYWFHPLVWLTARRLRAEGEIACDDLVLTAGVAAPDYARHLLDVARALRPAQAETVPQAAVAMARTARIEGRLTMILDNTRPRRALTRRALLLVLGLSAAALVPLAVLRPGARAAAPGTGPHPVLGTSQTAPAVLTVGDVPVRFLGVGSLKTRQYWGPDGNLLLRPIFHLPVASHADQVRNANTKQSCVMMAFRLPPSARDVTVKYDLTGSLWFSDPKGSWPPKMQGSQGRTEAETNSADDGARILTAYFPTFLGKTDVRIGTAAGAWTTAATDTRDTLSGTGGYMSDGRQGSTDHFIFGAPLATKNGLMLTISTNAPDDEDLKVVAVSTHGQMVLPTDIGDNRVGTLDQITARFATLTLPQIKEIRVETRPFQWTTFKNVALQPAP